MTPANLGRINTTIKLAAMQFKLCNLYSIVLTWLCVGHWILFQELWVQYRCYRRFDIGQINLFCIQKGNIGMRTILQSSILTPVELSNEQYYSPTEAKQY